MQSTTVNESRFFVAVIGIPSPFGFKPYRESHSFLSYLKKSSHKINVETRLDSELEVDGSVLGNTKPQWVNTTLLILAIRCGK